MKRRVFLRAVAVVPVMPSMLSVPVPVQSVGTPVVVVTAPVPEVADEGVIAASDEMVRELLLEHIRRSPAVQAALQQRVLAKIGL